MERERVKRTFLVSLRGLIQALRAVLAGTPLFVVSLLSIICIFLGVGIFHRQLPLLSLRAFANSERVRAGESGVNIPQPYRPQPDVSGVRGAFRRSRWLLADPATWRDLLWALLNIPVGLVLGVLPAALIVYGLEGIFVAPWVVHVADGYGYGPFWPLTWYGSLLSPVLGVAFILAGAAWGPQILRAHSLFTRSLLGPAKKAVVLRLTESRSDTLDASAAELRRIERDLHDGAQARLSALGMSIGMAEDLFRDDPEQAMELLAEAREASGKALAELRDLVRGIHPPVLAERGLDGAVRALALSIPMEVEIDIELPGRLRAPLESAVYFAIAEALANVVKHSAATDARVSIKLSDDRLRALVSDDGVGGADPGQGSGLRGIERRLSTFDGTIAVMSPDGGPTLITLELPCALSSLRTSRSSGTD